MVDDKSESSEEEEGYVNQYTLIYPSYRNTEEEYAPYMDHAQMCYEQFTGSYSRKNREKKEEEKRKEAEASKMALLKKRTITSPIKKPLQPQS